MTDKISQYKITDDEIEVMRSVARKLAKLATDRGWYDNPREKGTMIALMHSEISEALEGIRKDSFDEHLKHRKAEEVELADAIIRILDFGEQHGLDVPGALAEKHLYNASREDHSREARAKKGGKAF